jgi:hypothetical protein
MMRKLIILKSSIRRKYYIKRINRSLIRFIFLTVNININNNNDKYNNNNNNDNNNNNNNI